MNNIFKDVSKYLRANFLMNSLSNKVCVDYSPQFSTSVLRPKGGDEFNSAYTYIYSEIIIKKYIGAHITVCKYLSFKAYKLTYTLMSVDYFFVLPAPYPKIKGRASCYEMYKKTTVVILALKWSAIILSNMCLF